MARHKDAPVSVREQARPPPRAPSALPSAGPSKFEQGEGPYPDSPRESPSCLDLGGPGSFKRTVSGTLTAALRTRRQPGKVSCKRESSKTSCGQSWCPRSWARGGVGRGRNPVVRGHQRGCRAGRVLAWAHSNVCRTSFPQHFGSPLGAGWPVQASDTAVGNVVSLHTPAAVSGVERNSEE